METMIGRPLPRKEDRRLLTGLGCFSDDVNTPNQAFAAMVRSPHAHARIRSVDGAAALAAPGVLAVLSGADFVADGLGRMPHNPLHSSPPDIGMENSDGSEIFIAPHWPLPTDKARFVGEAVAMVVAESAEAAKDGAEMVVVDYAPLPAVTDTAEAAAPDAPRVWDEAPSNVCIDAEVGDRAAVEAAFARADHVVRLETTVARVTGVPMEPRAAVGNYDAVTGRYTVHAGSGGAVRIKRELAAVLGVPEDRVRVIARDVGGNYGTRNAMYPEFPLVAWAARRVGRPVKWTCERQDSFVTDYQARDLVVEAELALTSDGRILALRASNLSNIGAHAISFIPLVKGVEIMTITYAVPAVLFRARAVLSNTPSTYPYRSAGRPEVIYAMERLIDMAARELGLDRVEIRRRNMIPGTAMPYRNPVGLTYDSGEFGASMALAAEVGDWARFDERRGAAHGRGKLRGIGLANYVDLSTGAPQERAEIEVRPERAVDVVIGTQAAGQGHETSFAQVVADLLGAPYDSIRLLTGDTDTVKVGGGSHSGRSMRMGAIVLTEAVGRIIAKGRRIAAHVLEAAETDIAYSAGHFTVAGTDRSLGLFEAAAAAIEGANLPEDLRGKLAAESEIDLRMAAFGSGCHVCEVEIDRETGVVEIVRYAAVDDVGRAINPLLVDGQTHGGIVQGVGQALMEHCVYHRENGQMMSGSFLDYAMPRASDLPYFETRIVEVPTPTNPLGVKPGSEGGTAPAPAVVANAIVDALAGIGVRHIELPATPERVWRAIRKAES